MPMRRRRQVQTGTSAAPEASRAVAAENPQLSQSRTFAPVVTAHARRSSLKTIVGKGSPVRVRQRALGTPRVCGFRWTSQEVLARSVKAILES